LFGIIILHNEFRNASYCIYKNTRRIKEYKKDYDDIDLQVHGGLTYASNHLWISKTQKIEGWFVGWDYGHFGDYAGYEEMFPTELRTGGKKWTTEEIFKEVKEACYQLVKGADNIE